MFQHPQAKIFPSGRNLSIPPFCILLFPVSNSKFNLIFYEFDLVTRKKNFYKKFRVSNWKCDVTRFGNLISLLENSEPLKFNSFTFF